MRGIRFVRNAALIKELQAEPGVKRVEQDYARRAQSQARTIAESLAPGGSEIASTYEADENRLLTTHEAGHIVEWGSVNNPAYAVLRRAALATGAKFRDTGS